MVINNLPDNFVNDKEKIAFMLNILLIQIMILQKNIPKNKAIKVTDLERMIFSYVAKQLNYPEELLLIFKPVTLRMWYQTFFNDKKYTHKSKTGRPKTSQIIRNIICDLKLNNESFGYLRILGELKKLNIKVCKTTIKNILKNEFTDFLQKNSKWKIFIEMQLKKHIYKVCACDFKKVISPSGQSLFALFFMAISTREIIHVNTTDHPTKNWIEQQLREFCGEIDNEPTYLIRDNDVLFKHVDFKRFHITSKPIPKRQPEKNCFMERLIGSFTREAYNNFKDRITPKLFDKICSEFKHYNNNYRPHQGIHNLTIPEYKNRLKKGIDFSYTPTDDSYLFYDLNVESRFDGFFKNYYFKNQKVS